MICFLRADNDAHRKSSALPAFLLFCAVFFAAPAHALDSVTLQLKWYHQFQFAGYYAAKEKGYYREAGFDVNIVEAPPGVDPVESVLAGKAEFGVGTSSLLLSRNAGKPVVALGVIFQHSAYVLLTRQESRSIHDLVGKRIMLEPQSEEVLAYLKAEGIPLDKIIQVEHSYDPQDLISGKIDVFLGYVTDEVYFLDRAHFPYQAYTPRSAGIDFYGDNLFTTERELRAHPSRAKAFRDASMRGWHYAMSHHEEIVDLILAKYSQRHERDYLLHEAKQMMTLMQPDLIEIGYMNPGRWRHIASTYAGLGMLPDDFSFEGFLYDPNPQRDMTWFYLGLAGALLVIVAVSAIAIRFARLLAVLRRTKRRLVIAKEKSDTANLAKTEFLARMSHELRTPMTSILGFSELIATSPDEALTPLQREGLTHIMDSGRHLLRLINEILDLAQIESGNIAITLEPVAVNRMVENVFALVRPVAGQEQIHLSISETKEYHVLADKTRLKQALLNLVSNAIKYNQKNGFVNATFHEEQKGVLRITIHDTGLGIPEEMQPLMFEPFERLGKENSGIGGAGVGLAITKRLIELMHGTIGCKSAPGKGSSFHVELPICDAPENAVEQAREFDGVTPATPAKKHTILYVEDSHDNLSLIRRIFLRRPSVNLISAPDARIGIDLARAHRPDLVLMDINLPGMDGVTAMKRLKTFDKTRDVPVIAISGNALKSEIDNALREGFVHYITKPIRVSEFLDMIDSILKQ